MNRSNIKGHTIALTTILIWGTTFVSTKILLNDFKPIEILFIRFCIGLLALSVIYPRRLTGTTKKQEFMFMAAGLSGVTLYYLLENIALTYTSVSNVGVITSTAPFFTALLASCFLKGEKIGNNFFVGFAVAIIGIFLISFNGSATVQLNIVGDLLALSAAAVWAVYSIFVKKISLFGYNTIQTTRRMFFYGVLFMLPALFLFDFELSLNRFTKAVNIFNILFLSLGASALCFAAWNLAVKLLGAVKTSVYIYLIPIIALLTSVIVLKESLTFLLVLGTALTLSGLFISEMKPK